MSTTLTKTWKSNVNSQIHAETETINMTIDSSAINHIVERLTDLYSDPLESTVRELVSNGIDAMAHLENPTPLEVSFDSFSNTLLVKDYGVGMSKETLINIYSKYGASTKQKDFKTIGAYGLGAKAPLSYTDSFTIKTTSDGKPLLQLFLKQKQGLKLRFYQKIKQTNLMVLKSQF